MKPQDYLGGLAHVHTKLSNHPGHFESDQTARYIVETLARHELAGSTGSPVQYIMINEHASNPTKPHPLGTFSLRARALRRSRWQQNIQGTPILYGFEVSLLADGGIDLTPRLAENCELIIASIHKLPDAMMHSADALEKLLTEACDNPIIDVIGHPQRNIEQLTEYDWPAFFGTAARTGTAVEVNLNVFPPAAAEPGRYGLWAAWLGELAQSGAPVFIGTDLHNKQQLDTFVQAWAGFDDAGKPNTLRDCLGALAAAGITPQRVVNSDLSRLRTWLARPKSERHS